MNGGSVIRPPSYGTAGHTPRSRRQPRIRPHEYTHTYENCQKPEQVVFDIILGLDMNQIEPQLFPTILPLLEEKERQLREWRNQPANVSIQNAISYIQNYRYSNDPNQNPLLVSRSAPRYDGSIDLEDVAFNVDLAYRKQDYSSMDPRLYKYVLKELQSIHQKMIQKKDYEAAERAKHAYRKVVSLRSDNKYESIQMTRADSLQEKLEKSFEELENLKSYWKNRLQESESDIKNQMNLLERKLDEELQSFDKSCENIPLCKFSGEYLQLRTRENYMVKSYRYAEAAKVRKEADKLEAIEIERHKKNWIVECRQKREQLQKKCEEKKFVRQVNLNTAHQKLEKQATLEISQAERAYKLLQSKTELATSVVDDFIRSKSKSAKRSTLPRLSTKQSKASMFRKRAMINTVVYTKTNVF